MVVIKAHLARELLGGHCVVPVFQLSDFVRSFEVVEYADNEGQDCHDVKTTTIDASNVSLSYFFDRIATFDLNHELVAVPLFPAVCFIIQEFIDVLFDTESAIGLIHASLIDMIKERIIIEEFVSVAFV